MNKQEYMNRTYTLLRSFLQCSYVEFCEKTSVHIEQIDEWIYVFLLYPIVNGLERGILLVYDQDQVIADLSFMHGSLDDVLKKESVYDAITLDSDWSNLEYYTLCHYYFPDLAYPYCQSKKEETFFGEVIFFTNAYVTKSYRQKGIFFSMLDISKEMVCRQIKTSCILYAVFALDPDIPCYGPDTTPEPYYYSMKDEPARLRNKSILEKRGYVGVRLEDEEEKDGSKLWYALLKEQEQIVEVDVV